jgi:hypothetical protein
MNPTIDPTTGLPVDPNAPAAQPSIWSQILGTVGSGANTIVGTAINNANNSLVATGAAAVGAINNAGSVATDVTIFGITFPGTIGGMSTKTVLFFGAAAIALVFLTKHKAL